MSENLLASAGAPVAFTRTSRSYAPSTDTSLAGTSAIGGHAIEVRGDPDLYAALGLTLKHALTLLFAPTNYGLGSHTDAYVQPGDTVIWNGTTFAVKYVVAPTAPDGKVIVGRIVCAA